MAKYQLFNQYIAKVAEKFKQLDRSGTVRLISHLDCDGIAACSIMVKVLNQLGMKYSISIVKNLNSRILNELSKENHKCFIFTDLGSGQLDLIGEKLAGKDILILDHHVPVPAKKKDKVLHVNPHLFNIDGSKEISGSGVVYMFAIEIDKKNENMAHIAVIGAIGDVQENNGFLKLNDEILQTAVKKKKMKVETGLRLFGIQTRPLYKVLQYSTNPYIPDVSGSESGSIQFLKSLGINPKSSKGWKKYIHLTGDEIKKLLAGIVIKRKGEDKPEDILGNIYTLLKEEPESPLRDAKEFSTLLNACGRLGKASLGIGTCLNDAKTKKKALNSMLKYKREIVNAIQWFNQNKDKKDVHKEEGILIINTKENIMPTIIGTLASILAKSTEIKENTFILSLGRDVDSTTKVSLRIAGIKPNEKIDLRDIIKEIVEKAGGEAGGHYSAAGAIIETKKEKEFLETAKEVLRKHVMEEVVG